MPACDSKPWAMALKTSVGDIKFKFLNVKIIFGVVVGEVFDDAAAQKMSDLIGTCTPFTGGGVQKTSVMNFVFRLKDTASVKEIGIFLSGLGFEPTAGPPTFTGGFVAFTPDANTPSLGAGRPAAIPDVGETGTGTGNQT